MNELAIPKRASDIATERIFRTDSMQASLAELAPTPAIRLTSTVSRGAMIGLCLTTFAFGILLTWTVNRARPIPEARLPALQSPPAPALVPPPTPALAPSPTSALHVEPIVVAFAPPVFDALPLRRAVSNPNRAARVRAVRAIRMKRTAPAVEPESPMPALVAATPAPPPAEKWVDPFAE